MNVETSNGRYADDDAQEVKVPTISYPDDTAFINNSAEVGDGCIALWRKAMFSSLDGSHWRWDDGSA